jgi:hypothetical protein
VAASSEHGTLEELRTLDPYDFEHVVAEVWRGMGWEAEVSQQSNDQGIDIVATKHDGVTRKELIQAKRYGPNTTVGGPEIQQYASLRQQVPDADSVVVVTTSQFSASAEDLASRMNVKLVDGEEFSKLVEYHAPQLLGLEESSSGHSEPVRAPQKNADEDDLTWGQLAIGGVLIIGEAIVRNPEEAFRAVIMIIVFYAIIAAFWPIIFGTPFPLPRLYELLG